jgi:hypothetical protein
VEIRCDNCSHVGPAAEVRPQKDGVALICENCGHENTLDINESEATSPNATQADASPEAGAAKPDIARPDTEKPDIAKKIEGFGDNEQVRMWLRDDALKALIPEPGSGLRCRKCAHLLATTAENCSRCGLSRSEAERHAPGEAPWEQAPADKEVEYEQAQLLWESFDENPSKQALEKFVDFVRAEGLLDLGIRRLRFYLVEHPEDQAAVVHLRDLAESLQSRIIVAQVQAQASADEFQQDVSRFKNRMVFTALIFWGGVFLLFLTFFWDKCGSMPNL